jgi:hypothetical protein
MKSLRAPFCFGDDWSGWRYIRGTTSQGFLLKERRSVVLRRLRGLLLFDEMHLGALCFFQLLARNHSATQIGEPHQFELDSLQPFISLCVRALSVGSVCSATPKLLIQTPNVGDLLPELPYLLPKNL